jgi:tetratricopeptide (TPR) repeat protein
MKRFLTFALSLVISATAFAQLKMPAPSPLSTVTQSVGLAEVSIKYSRPSVKGRKIYGDLVPFDKIWRTGANRPTKIKFDDDLVFEGKAVSAGEYTLVSIPSATEWTIILNKDSKGNGAFSYLESDDVLRFKVRPQPIANNVENFTVNFADITEKTAVIELLWEKTAVRFKIENEIASKIEKQIAKELNPAKDASLYSQIATYYLDTNQKLPEALELITKSTDLAPRYWTLHTKAKIQAKLGKNTEAIESCNKSIELAKKDSDDNYVKMNEKFIEQLKKAK